MKAVFIIPQVIYPQNNGGKKFILGRIFELLDKQIQVKIICFNSNNESTLQLIEFCKKHKLELLLFTPNYAIKKKLFIFRILNYFVSIFSFKTKFMQNINNNEFYSILKKNIKEDDYLYFESIYFYDIYKRLKYNNKSYFLFHNVESDFLKEISKLQTNIFYKLSYFYESYRIKKLEKKLFHDLFVSDKLNFYFVTNEDKLEYMDTYKIQNSCNKLLLNNNNILIETKIDRNVNFDSPFLLFPGSILFEPNFEAMMWFTNNIFELFLQKYMNVKLIITGEYNSEQLQNFRKFDDKIIFTGNISYETLINLYSECLCVISPILSGSGIKVKNFEAIKYNIPTVMTQFSAIGINFDSELSYMSMNNEEDYLVMLNKAVEYVYKNK